MLFGSQCCVMLAKDAVLVRWASIDSAISPAGPHMAHFISGYKRIYVLMPGLVRACLLVAADE